MSASSTPTDTKHLVPLADCVDVIDRDDLTIVDLRSPAEHAADHLPGARCVPLFDDLERALVGTLYKRLGPEEAFDEGRRITLAKVGELVHAIAEAAGRRPPRGEFEQAVRRMTAHGLAGLEESLARSPAPRPPAGAVVLHCWRGGLRSGSVVALLRELGWRDAFGLAGGYKAYRRVVLDQLASFEAPPTFVLRGLTGVGKTLVLGELERLRPGWTLDLEACAGHRSSILGAVGLAPVSQKRFESRIAARLRSAAREVMVVEGESRKVGDAIQPESLWRALQSGTSIHLVAPLERRIEVLVADYLATPQSRDELRARLPFLEQRLGARKWAGEFVRLLESGREHELVEVLLERYYDPLYRHSEAGRAYAAEVDATDPARAAGEVAGWIDRALTSPL